MKPGWLEVIYAKGGLRTIIQLYDSRGMMRPEGYTKLCKSLYAPGHTREGISPWVAYDPRLFAMLYQVSRKFGKPIVVISAYRVRGQHSNKTSNHYRGRAIDFRLPTIPRRKLLAYLDASFRNAGIGWYPNSTFLHLDVRKRGFWWIDPSGPGEEQQVQPRSPAKKARRGTDPTLKSVHITQRSLYR